MSYIDAVDCACRYEDAMPLEKGQIHMTRNVGLGFMGLASGESVARWPERCCLVRSSLNKATLKHVPWKD